LNEGTLYIIVGLGFDIVGVFVILNPLLEYLNSKIDSFSKNIAKDVLSLFTMMTEQFTNKKSEDVLERLDQIEKRIKSIEKEIEDNYSKNIKTHKRVLIGTSFLILGFILQIIGNWYQNPPF